MPKFLEDKLKAEAAKEGKSGREADRYVYGAMNNMGAMHGSAETAKGAAMEAKHDRDLTRKPRAPRLPVLGSGSHGFVRHSRTET